MRADRGSRLLELVEVMDRLRGECPWDRQQTHRSLARYLLEETYEVLEAVDTVDATGDDAHLQEELGDLLLQVFFHARIAAERPDGFDIEAVAGGIVDKLVRRHPHVFAGVEVADADEVNANWETIKAAEKGRTSPWEGVPAALPALAYAEKVAGRLARDGFDVAAELADDGAEPGGSVGRRLLRLVWEARERGLDAEQELRDEARRIATSAGRPLSPGSPALADPR